MNYFYLFYIFIIFLCLGSFLNVVIYRFPQELNIILPRSYCVHCHQKLHWYHNIPVLSFLFLKRKCAFCHKKISSRYICIELLTGCMGLFLFIHFGLNFNVHFISASLFSLILIILIFIDIDHQLLPDIFTLGLLWLGLLFNLSHLYTSPPDAIIGAAAGYISLWSVAFIYQKITRTEGMGHGDFKLLAALGAWTGWQYLLSLILIASVSGLFIGGYLILRHKAHSKTPLPFGPYLAIAGWLMLIYPLSYII